MNLRYGKPFVLGLAAGAIGGWLASILGLAGTGFGITIIPGTLLYLNGQGSSIYLYGTCNNWSWIWFDLCIWL